MGDKTIPVYWGDDKKTQVGEAYLTAGGKLHMVITDREVDKMLRGDILKSLSLHSSVGFDIEQPPREVYQKHAACLERWPECEAWAYNPACCRFPKSCSCDIIPERNENG